jgi:hypothetical protein
MPIEIKGEQKRRSRSNQKNKRKNGRVYSKLVPIVLLEQFHLCTQCARTKAKGALVWSMRARGEL